MTHPPSPPGRQRGALKLHWVAIGFMLLAGAGWTALASMRMERNLFAEGAGKVGSAIETSRVQPVIEAAGTAANGSGPLRRCLIEGKTVVSNTACRDENPTTRDLKIDIPRGVEAPRVPAPAPGGQAAPQTLVDKMIEKQAR